MTVRDPRTGQIVGTLQEYDLMIRELTPQPEAASVDDETVKQEETVFCDLALRAFELAVIAREREESSGPQTLFPELQCGEIIQENCNRWSVVEQRQVFGTMLTLGGRSIFVPHANYTDGQIDSLIEQAEADLLAGGGTLRRDKTNKH